MNPSPPDTPNLQCQKPIDIVFYGDDDGDLPIKSVQYQLVKVHDKKDKGESFALEQDLQDNPKPFAPAGQPQTQANAYSSTSVG